MTRPSSPTLLATLLLLALPLAGCTGPAPDPPGSPAGSDDDPATNDPDTGPAARLPPPRPDPAAGVFAWSLYDCRFLVGVLQVPEEGLRAQLPEGFTIRTGANMIPPSQVFGEATLGFEAFACPEADGLEGRFSDAAYVTFWTAVTPPAPYLIDGIDQFYYKWDVVIPDDDRRAAMRDAGMDVRAGTSRVAFEPLPDGGFLVSSDAEIEGFGTIRVQGRSELGGQPRPVGNGSFVEYSAAQGGIAQWRSDFDVETYRLAGGIVELPEGSWVADLAGGTTVPTDSMWFGVWTFENATVQVLR